MITEMSAKGTDESEGPSFLDEAVILESVPILDKGQDSEKSAESVEKSTLSELIKTQSCIK